ncbi:methyl-accepting chemotaxis protein [Ectopseudomonas composti]|uniref:methyl-accepting chemotaxis protein n=1 Tax=Ectopseudomonas composti TaxID=658457 RepID=UPI000AEE0125|nr:methyl-accepting chemotaxis protein [Pseudomonas composti]
MNVSITRLMWGSALFILVTMLGLATWISLEIDQVELGEGRAAQLSEAREATQELRYHLAQVQQFYTDASLTQENEPAAEAAQHYREAKALVEDLRALLPAYADQLVALNEPVDRLDETGRRMFQAYSQQGKQAGDVVMEAFDAQSAAVIARFNELQQPLSKEFAEVRTRNASLLDELHLVTLVALVAIGLVVFAALLLINRRVLPPIRRLNHSMQDLASGSGDLTREINREAQDEIGAVVDAFNLFSRNLRQQIASVGEVAGTLEHSSGQLISDAQASERSAGVLREEIDQVVTAVHQMSVTVQGVAEHARGSSEQTAEADREVRSALKVIDSTINDIRQLAGEVGSAARVISELETHTQEIGGVLEVIRTIAEQTNLLALNAAIEAARAGEQGRGFAVVADEVRTLASRTQASTAEIDSMIQRLQGASRQAVDVMHASQQHAEKGVAQAETAGKTLGSIGGLVEAVSRSSQQIAEAAREQSQVSDEINQRVANLGEEAARSVSLAENTLQRGRHAGENSQRLHGIVGRFRY